MSQQPTLLDKSFSSIDQLALLLQKESKVSISPSAEAAITRCRNYLDNKLKENNRPFYGINTGFGFLQNVVIENHQLEELQSNLICSHACGMGEEVPEDIVKLMLALKIKSLAYGHSGVQLQTVMRFVEMFNLNVLPVIFTQGSLGASGDLAPLSHLALPLIAEGEVYYNHKKTGSAKLLDQLGWQPIRLQSKEGLALINGTQFMGAYGLYSLIHAQKLLVWANTIAALSFDAFDCSPEPFNERIHQIRSHAGQLTVATAMRTILKGSEICAAKKEQVQDPYSFRCIPQVHGACADVIAHVSDVFLKEINSVTDNPNIFPDEDLIVSGGNFHGQPLAMALDYLAIALAELGSISERRTYQLISGQRGLPPFLVKNPGLNSGLMIPQYTAAGIVSENKQLCTPASVDTIPSSNNQEDHVSMGANAATKCKRVLDNLYKILAIELFTAAQAMAFRKPLKTAPQLENLLSGYRKEVSFNEKDRILHFDLIKTVAFLQQQM